ncbi:MAG TPA: ATP-binding protein [Bacteroidales bacterium]|nr:ATP-binding protein [Bacteroidales bacterium]HRZ77066.1 ATP-binding protein [Bacteroidales bacterium]
MIDRTRELAIASDLREMHRVEAFIEEISDQFNINHTYFGHLLVAVTEAVENAIVHGNGGDAARRVVIGFEARESSLLFSVTDEGQGFDHAALADPLEAGPGETRGTGIFLISRLADEVRWVEPGNRIEFGFTIASINFLKSGERMRILKEYYEGSASRQTASLKPDNLNG